MGGCPWVKVDFAGQLLWKEYLFKRRRFAFVYYSTGLLHTHTQSVRPSLYAFCVVCAVISNPLDPLVFLLLFWTRRAPEVPHSFLGCLCRLGSSIKNNKTNGSFLFLWRHCRMATVAVVYFITKFPFSWGCYFSFLFFSCCFQSSRQPQDILMDASPHRLRVSLFSFSFSIQFLRANTFLLYGA